MISLKDQIAHKYYQPTSFCAEWAAAFEEFCSASLWQYEYKTGIEESDKTLVEKHGAIWYEVNKLPNLVLDHDIMIEDALHKLQEKAKFHPIGFELLPKKFTIPQLQKVYEAIYQKKMDSRNFRKKVLSFGVLIKLEEKWSALKILAGWMKNYMLSIKI